MGQYVSINISQDNSGFFTRPSVVGVVCGTDEARGGRIRRDRASGHGVSREDRRQRGDKTLAQTLVAPAETVG